MFDRDRYNNIAAFERMKEHLGLRWIESLSEFEEGGWSMRLQEPIEVTVRSSGFGWEAFSTTPEICCHGRTLADAMGFYRFCLSEYSV